MRTSGLLFALAAGMLWGNANLAYAQEKDKVPTMGSNVINFEAEIIQGEVRKPDIFVQVGSGQATMESILFSRKDFNDFHRSDKLWRPAFDEVKTSPKAVGAKQGAKK